MDYLFVYGTLMKSAGKLLDRFLPGAVFMENASVFGNLYLVGSYPGLKIDIKGSFVFGEIISFPKTSSLENLDSYEDFYISNMTGSEYIRKRHEVKGQKTGKIYNSWVYEYNRSPEGLEKLPSGRFLS